MFELCSELNNPSPKCAWIDQQQGEPQCFILVFTFVCCFISSVHFFYHATQLVILSQAFLGIQQVSVSFLCMQMISILGALMDEITVLNGMSLSPKQLYCFTLTYSITDHKTLILVIKTKSLVLENLVGKGFSLAMTASVWGWSQRKLRTFHNNSVVNMKSYHGQVYNLLFKLFNSFWIHLLIKLPPILRDLNLCFLEPQ